MQRNIDMQIVVMCDNSFTLQVICTIMFQLWDININYKCSTPKLSSGSRQQTGHNEGFEYVNEE